MTGTLVVRDVVADAEAQGWARSLLSAIDQRQGKRESLPDYLVYMRARVSEETAADSQLYTGTNRSWRLDPTLPSCLRTTRSFLP